MLGIELKCLGRSGRSLVVIPSDAKSIMNSEGARGITSRGNGGGSCYSGICQRKCQGSRNETVKKKLSENSVHTEQQNFTSLHADATQNENKALLKVKITSKNFSFFSTCVRGG
jgi:hypothetical protein